MAYSPLQVAGAIEGEVADAEFGEVTAMARDRVGSGVGYSYRRDLLGEWVVSIVWSVCSRCDQGATSFFPLVLHESGDQ